MEQALKMVWLPEIAAFAAFSRANLRSLGDDFGAAALRVE